METFIGTEKADLLFALLENQSVNNFICALPRIAKASSLRPLLEDFLLPPIKHILEERGKAALAAASWLVITVSQHTHMLIAQHHAAFFSAKFSRKTWLTGPGLPVHAAFDQFRSREAEHPFENKLQFLEPSGTEGKQGRN